ncbi:MAG: serine--tRNA ligase [Clostridiales bacterium]|jgi:seryl-tRNA synthetase|nr:serine--tRNA ligase [Clostridiales bacterium]
MLDIKFIRENPEKVKLASIQKLMPVDIDRLLLLDGQIRKLNLQTETLRTKRNALSIEMKTAVQERKQEIIDTVKNIKDELQPLEVETGNIKSELNELMLTVPSVPDPEVPVGKTDGDNVFLRALGTVPSFDFPVKDHVDLAVSLDLLDTERAVKFAGSRTYFLKNEGMLLEMAVTAFAIDHLRKKGFTPMSVPLMVHESAMTGTGYFPIGYDQAYKLPEDGLFLIGTSEVSLISYHQNEILVADELPKKYAGYSTCFRREAGTYGKDTRGLYRVHQFQKVEQVVICEANAEQMEALHQEILINAEEILQALELPYRVMLACTGETGIGQIKKYELETWMPSRNAYCETHSCSSFGDFQARRSNIKYRDKNGELKYCYTLNNTGIASPRILIPLLEINQQSDGSVKIPRVLQPYMGGIELIKPR